MLAWLRKGFLIYVLVLVAGGAWLSDRRARDWDAPLWVAIHPVAADSSPATSAYLERLDADTFAPIAEFLTREAEVHGLPLTTPVRLVLAPTLTEGPPPAPAEASVLGAMLWSLRLRWWAWRLDRGDLPPSDVDLFLRYFDPAERSTLAHSYGLRKGRVAVVNVFASRHQAGSNNVVIAHEMLHTLGAQDRYDPATGLPQYPHGYAEPSLEPRHPQTLAEVMGGRVPLGPGEARIPGSLGEVVIGALTASEIGWPVEVAR
ncbi:MAG: hypothetical protein H6983_18740 [Ectothiorhodospiraceae bacterium]|nr:hypothetical protein [Ectothiorhodospiraceae bacterium]